MKNSSFFEEQKKENEILKSLCYDEENSGIWAAVSGATGIVSLIFLMGFGSCFVNSAVTLSTQSLWAIVPTTIFAIIVWTSYKLFRYAINKHATTKK